MAKQDISKWNSYHQTKDNLVKALNNHVKSISTVNVYNNVSNTSGDHSLMNEAMGKDKIGELIKVLNK
ncbi:MAG: hypothetical protein QGH85_03025 [Candidatus Pacebacteria bacterium]|jgi:hypothetical protein|nr:hypothetical protein [Candidatus Paceibacterota bacterium]